VLTVISPALFVLRSHLFIANRHLLAPQAYSAPHQLCDDGSHNPPIVRGSEQSEG